MKETELTVFTMKLFSPSSKDVAYDKAVFYFSKAAVKSPCCPSKFVWMKIKASDVCKEKSFHLSDFNSILCAISFMSLLMLEIVIFCKQTPVCMRICSCCVTVSQAFRYAKDPTSQEKEHSKARSAQEIHLDDLCVKRQGKVSVCSSNPASVYFVSSHNMSIQSYLIEVGF